MTRRKHRPSPSDAYLLIPRAVVAAHLVRHGWQPYPDLLDVATVVANRWLVDRRNRVPEEETRARAVHLPQYGSVRVRVCGSETPTVGDVVDGLSLGGIA